MSYDEEDAMAQVFISYSRQDRDFVVTLQTALTAASRDVWVDLQDIPPTAAWLHEIYAGIEGADAFVYVLSPDSVASEVYTQELEYALRNSKRIVPLVYREVDASTVIEPVRALNWILFRPSDDFAAAFTKLTTALDTDLDYWNQSAQYLVRSRLWEAKHENASFVLRGTDLAEANQWLSLGVAKQPAPTPLHVRYITTSRRVAQRQQRHTISFLSGVSVLLAALAVAALIFSNEARIQSALATQQRDTAVFHQLLAESASNLDTHPDLALLDGLEATKYRNTTDSRTALFTALERYSYLDAVLQDAYAQNTEAGITNLAFSADGHTLLSVAPLPAANTSDQQTLMTVWDVQTRQPRLHFLVPGRADFDSGNMG
jgi:hypothetical protein